MLRITFLSRHAFSNRFLPCTIYDLSLISWSHWIHTSIPLSCRSQEVITKHNAAATIRLDDTSAVKLIRNAGIIAHIDAGKTTTTERMLFLARRTHHIGEVDRGDTVTDYLPEERERGISIVSAAACLTWKQHMLHLIDTPGHVDFTMEVDRSLAVMDGAIAILDGTEGVQAQTRAVWHQADRYHLPRLVFINKFDRATASLDLSLSSLSSQLSSPTQYVLTQWPVFEYDLQRKGAKSPNDTSPVKRRFIGLVDLISMDLKDWSRCSSNDSSPATMNLLQINENSPGPLTPETTRSVWEARAKLMLQLTEVDDNFADQFLSVDHPEHLPSTVIQDSVKRATHSCRITPVLVGSSRQGVGVGTLLDAIVEYLPDPSIRPLPTSVQQILKHYESIRPHGSSSSKVVPKTPDLLIMLVFKVCFDPHRGPLSLVRIYSGTVRRDALVTNWSRQSLEPVTEKVHSVYQLIGDRREVVDCAGTGSIVALAGLDSTHSGDLLGSPIHRGPSAADKSQAPLSQSDELCAGVYGDGTFSPSYPELTQYDPVVYAALEPASLSGLAKLDHALQCMQREDPSFTVKLNQETGQWTVGGMGDLHLEVIMARLKREYKVDARLGSLLIAYKESPTFHTGIRSDGFGIVTGFLDGTKRTIAASVTIESSTHFNPQAHIQRTLLGSHDLGGHGSHQSTVVRLHRTIRQSALSALESAGPLLRSPVVHVTVSVNRLFVAPSGLIPAEISAVSDFEQLVSSTRFPINQLTSGSPLLTLCRSAVTTAIMDGVKKISEWSLLEPMIHIELRLPMDTGDSMSTFLGDLSTRRAEILSMNTIGSTSDNTTFQPTHRVITAVAPLAELAGFSAAVRGLSSGRADLHLSLSEYRRVGADHQAHILGRFRWSPVAA